MEKVDVVEVKGHKFLFLDEYLWMWDILQEMEVQKRIVGKAFGDVLVVGYGFGMVHKFLLENQDVRSVVTVEKYGQVVDKMREFGSIRGGVIVSDFYDFETEKEFDCVVGDIWAEIDEVFLDEYLKFREKALTLLCLNRKVLGWGSEYFEYLIEKNR